MQNFKIVVNQQVRNFVVKYSGIKWRSMTGTDVTADSVNTALNSFDDSTPVLTDKVIIAGKKKSGLSAIYTLFLTSLSSVFQAKKETTELYVDASEKALIATISDKINKNETLTATEIQLLISNLVDSSPESLNTLNELAAALGDDPNFATTITNLIAGKVSSVTGKSLISDSEIVRLATVFNYTLSKAAIETLLTGVITSHSHNADDNKLDKLVLPLTKTASFTLALTDRDQMLLCNHATVAIVVTIPTNAAVPIAVGTCFYVKMKGAAQVSILAQSGVTIDSTKLKLSAVNSVCQLIKESTDVWSLFGGLKL